MKLRILLSCLLLLLLSLPLSASVGERDQDTATDTVPKNAVAPVSAPPLAPAAPLAAAPDNNLLPASTAVIATEEQLSAVLPPPLELGLEVPDHPLVRRYRAQYTTEGGLKYLSAVMQRSLPYREYIAAEIQKSGVPACILFLPVIESGFSATAVSRSGATGIWQFMRNSIGGYGIRISEWLDERRDPWITTSAAVRKLNDNYRELGDWYLALAAYNCGLGATKNAIRRAGRADYWYLSEHGYFKPETVHYVPKFLAISEILSRSAEYGIDWGDHGAAVQTATIPVRRAVDITILSRELGLETSVLKTVNPSLFYNITPPDAPYALRVPADRVEEVNNLLSNSDKLLLEYYLYKIRSGDTLYALALHYGISVEMIMQYNPGLRPSALRIGNTVVIPAIKQVGAYSGKKDSDTLDFSGTYTIKAGDTLWSIALAHNIQVETLAERNNLNVNSVLRLGMTLRVPIL